MEIDYADFIEVEMPDEFYLPAADLWCYGRDMRDAVPEVPTEISYTEEILVKWINGEMEPIDVVIPRSVWMDYNKQLTRTDYKPLDANNQHDPFDGKTGFVTQVNDFNTGEVLAGKLLTGGITINNTMRPPQGCPTLSTWTWATARWTTSPTTRPAPSSSMTATSSCATRSSS